LNAPKRARRGAKDDEVLIKCGGKMAIARVAATGVEAVV
jgi:hypothetical protein